MGIDSSSFGTHSIRKGSAQEDQHAHHRLQLFVFVVGGTYLVFKTLTLDMRRLETNMSAVQQADFQFRTPNLLCCPQNSLVLLIKWLNTWIDTSQSFRNASRILPITPLPVLFITVKYWSIVSQKITRFSIPNYSSMSLNCNECGKMFAAMCRKLMYNQYEYPQQQRASLPTFRFNDTVSIVPSFKLKRCSIRDVWLLWCCGSQHIQHPPYRYLRPMHIHCKNERKKDYVTYALSWNESNQNRWKFQTMMTSCLKTLLQSLRWPYSTSVNM